MTQFADWFAPSLLRTSLSLIVAALLVATCVKWMRLRSPGGEQWAWLLVLTQGVMFVWLTVPVPEDWLPQLQKVAVPIQEIVPATLPDVQAVPISDPPAKLEDSEQTPGRPRRSIEEWVEPKTEVAIAGAPPTVPSVTWRDRLPSWSAAACAIWLAGLIAVIAVASARYSAFARRLRGAHPAPADWSHEWRQLCAAAGIHRAIPLVVAKNLGPALCRLPSGYQLVVPEESWALLTSDQRIAIFRHELEHYRRGDVWRLLVVRLLASVHWFNPCAWWAARRYEAQSEFACDAAAAGQDPAAFSELLVQLAAGNSRRVTGVQAVAAGSVYERVQRLLGAGDNCGGWRAALPMFVASVAIIVAGIRLQAVASPSTAAGDDSDVAAAIDTSTSRDEMTSSSLPADSTILAAADATPAAAEQQAAEPPQDVAADEVAGVVVDVEGKPIPEVLIDVWSWHPGNETRTDAQGLFRLKGIDEKRRVEVLVTKEGYTPQHFAQQQLGARGWKIVLGDKTYLEGTITGADGQPAVGAEIRAEFGPVQADGVQIGEVTTIGKAGLDGKYRLYLKPEKYDIQIVAPGQGVKRLSDVVLEDGVAKPLSVTLERGVHFEARVVDSETGNPVDGFILWQWRAPFLFGRSDADGKITFDDLVPGATEFNCGGGEPKQYGAVKYYQHGPFGRWWSAQAMQEWERKQIDDPKTGWQRNFDSLSFDLQLGMSPVEIVVEQGVTVSGYVTDPDGNAVAGATVAPARTGSGNSLTGDTRYSEKTGADGKFHVVLPASNASQYNLTVHDGEYQEWRKWANGVTPPMQTKPGQVIEGFELQLTKPATIRGNVTFVGKPAAGREVRTHSFDKLENRYYDPTTTTDKDGNFELKFVRAGKQYLQAEPFWLSAESAPNGSRVIEVAPGQVLEGQDLVAGRLDTEPSQALAAAKFQARVVDADGKPVPGASVGLGAFGGAPHYLETWRAHLASLGNAAAAEKLPVTGDDGLIDLQTQYLVQSRQTTAQIYAVDAAGGRAGTVLFNLDDYATIDPNGGPQIVDVPIASLTPTRIMLNAEALDAAHFDASERLMLLEIEKDGLPLQRILGTQEPIEMLLPPGEYAVSSNQWFAERIQTTFQIAANAAPSPVEIELKLSRLGSLVGNPAPELAELKTPDNGANPSLAQFKGKIVVLDFWGHWCGPCVQSMPNLMTLYDEFKDRGVEFVAVHDDSVESWSKLQPILDKLAKERWDGRAIPFPVVLDGGGETPIPGSEISVNGMTTATYGIWSWPTTIVIDREGRVKGLIGPHDLASSRKILQELLEAP